MKKLCMLLLVVMISFTANAQSRGTITSYSKYQNKNIKKFSSGKRHKRWIPFKNRAHVAHPAVRNDSKRLMKRRFQEDVWTKSNY